MKVMMIGSAALTTILATGVVSAEAPGNPHAEEAKVIVQEFATTLQGELQGAMQAGGPTNAIAVCQERAPAIAAELSERTGWRVARTSLKPRNPNHVPDAWEEQVLVEFDARQAAGEDVQPMAFAEVVETPDGETFRFMKAIPTAEVCILCHGSDLMPELVEAIDERYPEDMARGYSLGEVRGAFSLSKPL